MKTILQTVSGGFDSTFLLIKNLEEGNIVYPVYVHSPKILDTKRGIEENNVNNLIKRLQKGKNENVCKVKDLLVVNVDMPNLMTMTSIQPILFTLGLFSALNSYYNTNYTMKYHRDHKDCIEFDEVQLGYIMNDDAVSLLNEIRSLWESLKGFLNPCFIQGRKYPQITFPLIKYFKSYIVSYLFDNYYDIALTRWTCEDPKLIKEYMEGDIHHEVYAHCGKCNPCKKLKSFYRNHQHNFHNFFQARYHYTY